MWDCSEKLKDHFFNPRNAGRLADANAVGEVGSLARGDALRLMLRVNPQSEVIEAARFQAFGCGPAIAASSALTGLVIGRTVEQARRITSGDIAAHLDGLPPQKLHCSVMGQEALGAAIAAWRGAPAAHPAPVPAPAPIAIRPLPAAAPAPTAPAGARTPAQEAELVARTVEAMRPVFQRDGGDVELVALEGAHVLVTLRGACAGCAAAVLTLGGLQKRISEALGRTVRVRPVARA